MHEKKNMKINQTFGQHTTITIIDVAKKGREKQTNKNKKNSTHQKKAKSTTTTKISNVKTLHSDEFEFTDGFRMANGY